MTTKIIDLNVDEIRPSPFNPRKHFDEGAIAELANSIRQVGVQQPVIVRVVAGEFELVFGHRRLKAAKLAGLAEIPAIERGYSDDQVLEIQIVENSQREDVHPLDEADGFKALIDRGYTIAKIADKIGRTAAFIAQRLQLCHLGKEGRAALDNEHITLGAAMAIARVPTKIQSDVVEDLVPDWKIKEAELEGPISGAHARRIIATDYMLRLDGAPFDIAEAALVAKAGSCSECPKATQNQPELFDDIAGDALCTDAACYKSKCDALWKRLKKDPGEGVAALIEGKKAADAIAGYYNSDYVRTDAKFYYGSGNINVAAVIKRAKAAAPPIALGQDPDTGHVVKLVKRDDILKLARDQAPKTPEGKPKQSKSEIDRKAALKRENAKRQLEQRAIDACIAVGVEKAQHNVDEDAILRMVVSSYALRIWSDHQRQILKRRAIEVAVVKRWGSDHKDYSGTLQTYVQGLDVAGLRGMAAELAMLTHAPGSQGVGDDRKGWSQLLEALKVDEKAVRKGLVDQAKQKAVAKKKPKAKKRSRAPAEASA